MTQQTAAKHVQTAEDALRGIYLADEADGLGVWNTDQLFEEALQRSAGDAPALQRMQEIILKALLAAVQRSGFRRGNRVEEGGLLLEEMGGIPGVQVDPPLPQRRAFRVDSTHIRTTFSKKPANPTAVGYWVVQTGQGQVAS